MKNTFFQVGEVQQDFQKCSHNKSLQIYEEIQRLQEGRNSRDTNDIANELARPKDAPLDPLKDLKPRLCLALKSIAKDCIESFNKCFSREDAEQIKRQHIGQMQEYYAKIYNLTTESLQSCPQLQFMTDVEDDTEDSLEASEGTEDSEDDDYYEDYDYQDYEYKSTEKTTTSSSTTQMTQDEMEDYPIEGNAVIAEPPSFIGASYAASSTVLSLDLAALLVLCFLALLHWLMSAC